MCGFGRVQHKLPKPATVGTQVLTPGTHECVLLHDKRNMADVTNLRISRQEDQLLLARGLDIITGILVREKRGYQNKGERTHKVEAEVREKRDASLLALEM